MKKKWQLIQSEIVFNHKWYRLRKDKVRLPNGHIIDDYFVSERVDVVLVFALTTKREVIIVEQYKHAASEVLLEFPGGFFDNTKETPRKAALRELIEETGYAAGTLVRIAKLIDNPTKDSNRTYLYVAYDCVKIQEQELDDTEQISVHLYPLNDIEKMILKQKIKATLSVALGLLALKKIY